MPTLLQIAQLGHPVLRAAAARVPNTGDAGVQTLIDNMLATLADVGGLGIAAPQVYESHRIFIISSKTAPAYPDAAEMPFTAMINPGIADRSAEGVPGWEGCLSIPGIRGLVPRHRRVTVSYSTREGKGETMVLQDLAARVFQHELDHLDGIVYLDRLESMRDVVSEKEYQRIVR